MKKLQAAFLAASCGLAAPAMAQGPLSQPGFVAGGPAAVRDVLPAVHQSPATGSSFVNAHGEPFVTPAQYCASCPPGGGGYGGGYPGGVDPFGGAVFNTPQSGPHYFDISAEFLHYQRETDAFGGGTVSVLGFANEDLADVGARTVLSSSDLDSNDLNGFRLVGRLDLGALSVVEFTYSGLYGDGESASTEVGVNNSDRLFSVFSRFGTRTNGPTDQSTPGVPRNLTTPPDNNPNGVNFRQTDFATRHEITFDYDLQTAEASYRRYWVGFNPRVSGTLLAGFRYTQLTENAGFFSLGTEFDETNPAAPVGSDPLVAGVFNPDPTQTISIDTEAINSLAGFQVGGDAWVTLFQGFRVGGEGKVGVYANDYQVTTAFTGGTGPGTVFEDTQVAFLTEWKLSAVADITPSLSLRGGYEVLYLSELALAGDALLVAQPYGDVTGQSGAINTGGEAFFHGFHAGAEYVW